MRPKFGGIIENDAEANFHLRILSYLILLIFIFFLTTAYVRHLISPLNTIQWVNLLAVLFLYVVSYICVVRFRFFGFGSTVFWVAVLYMIAALGYLNGGIRSPAVATLILLPLVAAGISGIRVARIIFVFSLIIIVLLYVFERHGLTHPFQLNDVTGSAAIAVVYIGLTFVSYFTGYAYENSRKLAEAELLELSRILDFTTLAGGISHEINNPLTSILFCIELLKRKATGDSFNLKKIDYLFDRIERGVKRIRNIITSLKIYSGDEPDSSAAELSIKDVIVSVLVPLHEAMKTSGVKLHLDKVKNEKLIAKKSVISQALFSLISNSLDAVKTSPEKWIRVETRAYRDFLEVLVIDSGEQISPEIRMRLFEPFFTTKGPEGGKGLGLAISSSALYKSGGRLYFDEHAKNTTFVLHLPRAPEAPSFYTKVKEQFGLIKTQKVLGG